MLLCVVAGGGEKKSGPSLCAAWVAFDGVVCFSLFFVSAAKGLVEFYDGLHLFEFVAHLCELCA